MAYAVDPANDEELVGLAEFISARRRERILLLLRDPRKRRKLHAELAHLTDDLDPRWATRLAPEVMHDQHVGDVLAMLVRKGAPRECFVVGSSRFDRQRASLAEAVPELMAEGMGLISCRPGTLALYVGEDGSDVVLLERRAQNQ